jgi:hypothetical protein
MTNNSELLPCVPERPPYGSITDGSYVCSRCGEAITGCFLCAGEPIALIRNRMVEYETR